MKTFLPAMLLMVAVSPAVAQTPMPPSHDPSAHDVYLNTKDLKWDRLVPELGAGSPEITILHKDPKSGATQLMIRSPAKLSCAQALAHRQRDAHRYLRHLDHEA